MNFCTYFDSRYFPQGMALLASLRKWAPDFHLDVLALDKPCYERIPTGPQVTAYYHGDVTGAANIWRLTPAWVRECLGRRPSVSYIDADCFFFGVPHPLPGHIGIIPHRWTPKYAERLRANGEYNVGMVTFDTRIMREGGVEPGADVWRCLYDWQAWCDAGFPDQRHLDIWPHEYGATVCYDLGYNLAPYNQEQYGYDQTREGIYVSNGNRRDRLAFYHFHEWKIVRRPEDGAMGVYRSGYTLDAFVANIIYPAYEQEVRRYGP